MLAAAKHMEKNQIPKLLILNRASRLIGIMSLDDLAILGHGGKIVGSSTAKVSAPYNPTEGC